jgi:hypothetical protein
LGESATKKGDNRHYFEKKGTTWVFGCEIAVDGELQGKRQAVPFFCE